MLTAIKNSHRFEDILKQIFINKKLYILIEIGL